MRAVDRTRISRARCIHHVIGGIERERNIVRNPENSVAGPNHCAASQTISHANPWSEVVQIKRNIVARPRRNEKHISHYRRRTGRKVSIQIALRLRVEVGKSVVAFRPRALKLITESKIQSKRAADMPSVAEIERAILLLAGGEGRNNGLGKKMVLKITEVVGVSQQKIGKGKPCEAGLTGRAEIEGSAGYVRLRIIFVAGFELKTEVNLVMPAHEHEVWRKTVLGIAILNEALPLRTHDIVGNIGYAGRGRSAHDRRDRSVVARRPSDGSQIE